MNKNLIIILAIFHLTKTIAQNTEENSPNRGQDPCARPQIVTNPFAPQNTEVLKTILMDLSYFYFAEVFCFR